MIKSITAGWFCILFCISNVCTSLTVSDTLLRCLCSHSSHPNQNVRLSCRSRAAEYDIVGGDHLGCHFSSILHSTGLQYRDFIYVSFHNQVGNFTSFRCQRRLCSSKCSFIFLWITLSKL